MEINDILSQYFSDNTSKYSVKNLDSGHINSTFLIENQQSKFILQKLNTNIFTNPEVIINNSLLIGKHLETKKYPKPIISPIQNRNGDYLTKSHHEAWRLTPYIENSVCFETVLNREQAYETAKALSEFHNYLLDLDVSKIKSPIDGFLDFEKRISAFNQAISQANETLKKDAENEIQFVFDHLELLENFIKQIDNNSFPQRIIHADPKISNVLFHANNPQKTLAIIDWDTMMTGTILYDFGDMIRSYTNLKAEDDPTRENNFSEENYQAIKDGFLFHLKDQLTETELLHLDSAAFCVILVQAIRFLTDYLNGNIYYSVKYPNQNLNRTQNQINLLKEIQRLFNNHKN